MSSTPDVIVCGHICLDIIPDVSGMDGASPEAFFVPGKLVDVGRAAVSTGGAVSNTGLALRILGIDAALAGKVGDDPFGRMVQDVLQRYDAAGGLIVDADTDTSYTVVLNPPGLDRMFLHCPAANDSFRATDVDPAMLAGVRLMHFGYPPLMRRMYEQQGAELVDLFRAAKSQGVTTSLDMALPDPAAPAGRCDWEVILKAVAPFVDLFLPSIEELLFMLDRPRLDTMHAGGEVLPQLRGEDLHNLSDRLLEMGMAAVCIKCGQRGLYLRTAGQERMQNTGSGQPENLARWGERELWHPVFRIEGPPHATGSGDSAIAGLLAAWLRGLGPTEALRCSAGCGACNVSAPDALSGLPSWPELQHRLVDWPTVPLHIEETLWRCEEEVWIGPADKT